jgi:hypothetical protein
MFTKSCQRKKKPYTTAWLLRNWHIILPEDGTQVPKHVGETHLKYVRIINNAFRWYNLKKMYAEIKNARNGKL